MLPPNKRRSHRAGVQIEEERRGRSRDRDPEIENETAAGVDQGLRTGREATAKTGTETEIGEAETGNQGGPEVGIGDLEVVIVIGRINIQAVTEGEGAVVMTEIMKEVDIKTGRIVTEEREAGAMGERGIAGAGAEIVTRKELATGRPLSLMSQMKIQLLERFTKVK